MITLADRIAAVSQAAAHDLNNELTIILNNAADALELLKAGHPALPYISQVQQAAERCVWISRGLEHYATRRGIKPTPAPMTALISNQEIL